MIYFSPDPFEKIETLHYHWKPLLVDYSYANELGAEAIERADYETIMEKVKDFMKSWMRSTVTMMMSYKHFTMYLL